ncbi:MAG: hypothetical protein EOO03_05950 [Chitinophagaceae bacterium]|nr:MAG: hypothetical protein EOO03_05950 [Chitinophagaceae bacterium]
MNNRKTSAIILAGLAGAFAYYKYSKMSAEDKNMLVDKIKTAGKDLLSQLNLGSLNSLKESVLPADKMETSKA